MLHEGSARGVEQCGAILGVDDGLIHFRQGAVKTVLLEELSFQPIPRPKGDGQHRGGDGQAAQEALLDKQSLLG